MEPISMSIADVAASLTVALIMWGIASISSGRKAIVKSVTDLGDKVNETNGRVIKLETEIVDHINHDDERFARQDKSNDDIWEKLNNHIERRVK